MVGVLIVWGMIVGGLVYVNEIQPKDPPCHHIDKEHRVEKKRHAVERCPVWDDRMEYHD